LSAALVMTTRTLITTLLVAWAVALPIATAHGQASGIIGPRDATLPSGQRLEPAGGGIRLGSFSEGGALTPDGRFWWSASTGWGTNDVRIVDLATRRVIQVIPLPGASGGMAMDPRRGVAYVSVVGQSMFDPPQRNGAGNAIEAFRLRHDGHAAYDGTIHVPPPSGAPTPQTFPLGSLAPRSWPDAMAIAPDGRHLVVALNMADAAAVIALPSRRVRYVSTGSSPHGVAVLPGSQRALVANETPGTLTVVDVARARAVKTIHVGKRLSHPGAITVDPEAQRAYVALANADAVAVVDTRRLRLESTIPITRLGRLGTSPVALALTPDRSQLLVAEAGANEIAVVAVRGRPRLAGRIPVASYPTAVAVAGGPRPRIVWQAGKSLGIGPNPRGPSPLSPDDPTMLGLDPLETSRNLAANAGYPPGEVMGELGIVPLPSARTLRKLTARADAALVPDDPQKPPADTPLRPGGPIRYVFWVVRENRSYDQTLGDVARGDGDPQLTLFGTDVTPNVHALVTRFPLLDHVYANSEGSIQGHYITAGANVPDYAERNFYAGYAGRPRAEDFGVFVVSWPGTPWLFDAARAAGVPYFNYGEALAGTVGILPDKDRTRAELAQIQGRAAHSDLGPPVTSGGCYDNFLFIGRNSITGNENFDDALPAGAPPGSTSRFDCFRERFRAQLRDGTVPAFNYLTLPNNHSLGTSPGKRTPTAMVAENDEAVGQLVAEISHSPIWPQTAIFVTEDDSQDGADHVDAHRIDAEVISPYTQPGAVVTRRYDLYSSIRSMELILGIDPVSIHDKTAVPMYDVFSPTPDNLAPYDAIRPAVNQLERNPGDAPGAALSTRMNRRGTDGWPQRVLDRVLWRSVHGRDSTPPPPGPNATHEDDDG
jgi:DNA-binding beta-propeller fold protein YncE